MTRWTTWCLAGILAVLCFAPTTPSASEGERTILQSIPWVGVAVDPDKIIKQSLYGDMACMPTSLLNALTFGPPEFQAILPRLPGATTTERLSGLIRNVGSQGSKAAPGEPLYTDKRGVLSKDMTVMTNLVLQAHGVAPLSGLFLDVLEKETPEEHLRRVHGLLTHSLQAGVPVLTSIRSFSAKREKEDAPILWEGMDGHAVLVIGIPQKLESWQRGFAIRLVDPWVGSLAEAYVHVETIRAFQAARSENDKEFRWIDRGFLHIDVPTLSLGTGKLPWYARSFFTLNYVCGRFPNP